MHVSGSTKKSDEEDNAPKACSFQIICPFKTAEFLPRYYPPLPTTAQTELGCVKVARLYAQYVAIPWAHRGSRLLQADTDRLLKQARPEAVRDPTQIGVLVEVPWAVVY